MIAMDDRRIDDDPPEDDRRGATADAPPEEDAPRLRDVPADAPPERREGASRDVPAEAWRPIAGADPDRVVVASGVSPGTWRARTLVVPVLVALYADRIAVAPGDRATGPDPDGPLEIVCADDLQGAPKLLTTRDGAARITLALAGGRMVLKGPAAALREIRDRLRPDPLLGSSAPGTPVVVVPAPVAPAPSAGCGAPAAAVTRRTLGPTGPPTTPNPDPAPAGAVPIAELRRATPTGETAPAVHPVPAPFVVPDLPPRGYVLVDGELVPLARTSAGDRGAEQLGGPAAPVTPGPVALHAVPEPATPAPDLEDHA